MYQFIASVQAAVIGTNRVLQAGGVVEIAIWTKNECIDPWNIACRDLDAAFKPVKLPPGLFEWLTTEYMATAFFKAGFEDLRMLTKASYLVFGSAEQYAEAFLTAKILPG